MRTGRAFWGAFLLTAGLLLLLERLAVLPDGWQSLWRFWPLVVLAWGVGVLLGKGGARWIAAGIAGLILGLTLVALFTMSWIPDDRWWHREPIDQVLHVPWDSTVERATLVVDGGAGKFVVQGSPGGLLEGECTSTLGEYRLTQQSDGSERRLRLSMAAGPMTLGLGNPRNRLDVRLHPAPVWELDIDVGAAILKCDLAALDVKRLDLNTGASTVDLRLGGRAELADVRINAGASKLRITLPDSVGAELSIDAPLSHKAVRGFEKKGSGLYRSEGFESASRRIRVEIDAGVSSVTVRRE